MQQIESIEGYSLVWQILNMDRESITTLERDQPKDL
jgi:hypothetical protein